MVESPPPRLGATNLEERATIPKSSGSRSSAGTARSRSRRTIRVSPKLASELELLGVAIQQMKSVSVSVARASLSSLIQEVRQGETVIITNRGEPVARIEPCSYADGTDGDRLASLVARGVAIPPSKRIDPSEFLAKPRLKLPDGVDTAKLLRAERDGSW